MRVISASLPSTFTTQTALACGLHPRDLYAWRDGGHLVELGTLSRAAPRSSLCTY